MPMTKLSLKRTCSGTRKVMRSLVSYQPLVLKVIHSTKSTKPTAEFEMDEDGEVVTDEYGQPIPTNTVVNGGHPIAVSVYRPFDP